MQLEPRQVHAPGLKGEFINSPPLTMRKLLGRVVLIDFWDYTCVNCIRTLPYVLEWHRKYRDKGLVAIGVHAPEFAFARRREHVAAALRDLGIDYPVLLDRNHATWDAFANHCWPAEYLVDGAGYIRYSHFGEGGYDATEEAIRALLRERDPTVELPPPMDPVHAIDAPGVLAACPKPTPEIYLGVRDVVTPVPLEFLGEWERDPECAEVRGSRAAPSRLVLEYAAAEVNLVMAGPGSIEIFDNAHPVDHQSRGEDVCEARDGTTYVEIDRPRMYRLVKRDRFLERRLEVRSVSAGLRLYAFTFGTCVPRS